MQTSKSFYRNNTRKVAVRFPSGETKVFDTILEASQETGVSIYYVRQCLKKDTSYKGFSFIDADRA